MEESGCLEMMEALLNVRFTIDQLVDIYLYFFRQCELIPLWVDSGTRMVTRSDNQPKHNQAKPGLTGQRVVGMQLLQVLAA